MHHCIFILHNKNLHSLLLLIAHYKIIYLTFAWGLAVGARAMPGITPSPPRIRHNPMGPCLSREGVRVMSGIALAPTAKPREKNWEQLLSIFVGLLGFLVLLIILSVFAPGSVDLRVGSTSTAESKNNEGNQVTFLFGFPLSFAHGQVDPKRWSPQWKLQIVPVSLVCGPC
jgi:hypothetical protein